MNYRGLSRELFKRTRHKETISVNDLRDQNWEKLFTHHNQIGAFFRFLVIEELAVQVGHEMATHKAAKGREVKEYKWTSHAWSLYNR